MTNPASRSALIARLNAALTARSKVEVLIEGQSQAIDILGATDAEGLIEFDRGRGRTLTVLESAVIGFHDEAPTRMNLPGGAIRID